MFPPCKAILEQQTKRAWLMGHFYKAAVQTYRAINHTPIDFGWGLKSRIKSNGLKVTKFHLSQSLLIHSLTQKKVRMKEAGTLITIMGSTATMKTTFCKMLKIGHFKLFFSLYSNVGVLIFQKPLPFVVVEYSFLKTF